MTNSAIQVSKWPNGQYEVTHNKITLIHTNVKGIKFNDCSFFNGETYELISQHDPRVKPLFIALHNFKTANP
jgi:hypothetical protein